MNKKLSSKALLCAALGLWPACGHVANDSEEAQAMVTGVTLELGTVGSQSGADYRLKGEFVVTNAYDPGADPLVVSTPDDGAAALDIPLEPGAYVVELKTGWQLTASLRGLPFYPVDATLRTFNPQEIYIDYEQSTRIRYEFGLGEAEAELTVAVDEHYNTPIPDGYDALLLPTEDTLGTEFPSYEVLFANGYSECCWYDTESARSDFAARGLSLYVAPGLGQPEEPSP